MKSSRSSSQLTDGGAAGGVVWLDEPLAFPFLSFLDLRSCTGEEHHVLEVMVWGALSHPCRHPS